MTPLVPGDPAPSKPVPPSNPYRGELTRQLMGAHRANSLEIPPPPVDEARLELSARAGAQWFYWVAALSVVNSIIALSGGHLAFLAALALPQVADAFAAHLGYAGLYFSLGTDLLVAFFFCGFGYLTLQGSRAAFFIGIVFYVLDGALFLYFTAYLSAGFHAWVLWQMFAGWTARQKLARLRAERAVPDAGL